MDIKVTKIKNRYHARLIYEEAIIDEMACEEKRDIGWICKEMLMWSDKTGYSCKWTSAARKHHSTNNVGKIWYRNKL